MRKTFIFLLLILSINSCKSKKQIVTKKHKAHITKKATTKTSHSSNLAHDIVDYAMQFDGIKYKYGGTTKKGMDCSGLVYTTYNNFDISVPRTTTDLAKKGNWIDLKLVQPGDLLFFATRSNSRKVNHVGIVTYANVGNVEFIHASTSKGVIVSSLAERYWYFAFVQARRIL